MPPDLDADLDVVRSRLRFTFPSAQAAGDFLSEVRASGGFMVALEEELPQFGRLSVSIALDSKTHTAFQAAVAQIFPGEGSFFQTAFLVEEWSRASEKLLLSQLEAGSEADQDTSETRGVAAVHRIQQMNPGEKARLATLADRAERQVLLRDSSAQVLQSLLANPRLEVREVLQIVKSTHANGGLLSRIVGDARWGKNQEILAAAVKNPKTPTPLATRLVDKLRTSDLRPMAKMSGGLKEVIRRAALREYLKRSGR